MSKKNGSYTRKEPVTEPTVGEYKGYPTITIPLGDDRDFSFGVKKAQAIVEHIEAIKKFAADS